MRRIVGDLELNLAVVIVTRNQRGSSARLSYGGLERPEILAWSKS